MKALLAPALFGIFLILLPIALVSVPAAAVVEVETAELAVETGPAWTDCGMSLECLR
jgi:hypothetical protein